MGYNTNWDDVQDNDFPVVPEGTYSLFIVDMTETFTKTGDVMWKCQFEIIDNEQYAGVKIFTNFIHNTGGMGKLKKLYSACSMLDVIPLLNIDVSDLIGQKVKAEVFIGKEYQGKKRNEIPYAGFSEYEGTADQTTQEVNKDEIPF